MNALRLVLRYSAWLVLAYLGYWTAVFFHTMFVQAVVYPLLGSPLEEWRLTAFRAFVTNGAPETLPFSLQTRELIVLFPQALLLFFALRLPAGNKRVVLRAWSLQAALWTVILRGIDSALLAFLGRGSLAVLLGALTLSKSTQVVVAVVLALVLLGVGALIARRLMNVLAHFERGEAVSAWRAVALLVLSVYLVVGGYLDFQFQLLGLRALLFLSFPSAFCLAAALLGLVRKRRTALDAASATVSPLGTRTALVSLLAGSLVYGGLANAHHLEQWSYARGLRQNVTRHYEIRHDPKAFTPEFLRKFSEDRERTFDALTSRLLDMDPSLNRDSLDRARFRIILYDDLARKRDATRSDHPYTVEGSTLHVLIHGYAQKLDPAADAAALLDATWGTASSLVVRDWAARFVAAEWHGESIGNAAARIEREEGHYPLGRLLEASRDSFLSPLVREPLGAAWMASLQASRGVEAVRSLYAHAPDNVRLAAVARLLGTEPAQLEAGWELWTGNLAAGQVPVSRPARAPDPAFFLRGVSFSHEGWGRRRGGYTGPEAEKQLELLHAMKVNAIAVVPYGFQESERSTILSTSGADETDEELTQALFVAHQLGQKVMLKPQIWIGAGVFTGEIRFSDPAERARWFRSYRAFILHYARLAEQEGFDLLCIGNELGGMSQHAGEWRDLISQIRRVYRGPVTYAANWGEEFESVSFWDALDYIGLNHYYPLRPADVSSPPRPIRAEDLVGGAEKVARAVENVSQKYGRPVIFTEIGYPSVRGGTAEPWVEDGGRGRALDEQAAAYEACFRVYSNKRWLRGMFWWKWNSNGRGGGEQDGSFTPMRKPAADVLRTWYERLANSARADKPGAPKHGHGRGVS